MPSFNVIESVIEGLNAGTVSIRAAVASLAAYAAAQGVPFSESVARRTKAACVESAFKLRTAIEAKVIAERKRLPQPSHATVEAWTEEQAERAEIAERKAAKAAKAAKAQQESTVERDTIGEWADAVTARDGKGKRPRIARKPAFTPESIKATVEQLAETAPAQPETAEAAKPTKTDAEVREEAFAPVQAPAQGEKAKPAKAPAKPRRGAPAEAFEPEAKPVKPAKTSRFDDSTQLVVLVREAIWSNSGLAVNAFAFENAAKLGTNAEKLNKEVRNVIDRLRSKGEKIARVAPGVFRAGE